MSVVSPENEPQQSYWNEPGGAAWTLWQERMDLQLAPFGHAVIDALAPNDGERVLDIGCGCGDTTLQVARLVGPSGDVTGVDLSSQMLARARERAIQSGSANTRFVETDAQIATVGALGGSFDASVSRFGVMFFADPVAAFVNIASLSRPGGRLALVCWQSPEVNRWMSGLAREVASLFPAQPPFDPFAPGPFAFADPERTAGIVGSAGWVSISVEPCVRKMRLFGTDNFDIAVEGSLVIGAAARLLSTATEQQLSEVRLIAERVMRSLWAEDGAQIEGACWLLTAERPL